MRPEDIQLIGNELCIRWDDGSESYFPAPFLRKHSPSAQNIGEVDILGNRHGGDGPKEFPNVTITGWELKGNYAICPTFSDGHNSGIYSWQYLKDLEKKLEI
ncbi:MAG: gamma-butyrobetaine hydroxylase-like domain-containing protein [Opitutales bacterium]